jgi:predicted Zn-dependent protease
MENRITAFFYDGKSSSQQEIELFFDSNKECIHFVSPDGAQNSWPISEIEFDQQSTVLQLSFGTDLIQHIKIEDSNFIKKINQFRKEKGLIGWYQKLIDLKTALHWGIAVSIIAIIGLCYMYVIPWVGEKSVVLIPEEYDNNLGTSAWIENEYFVAIDSSKTKILNDFAKQLNLKNTKELKFTVVESNDVNAFAMPDGNIVVFNGILNEMKNYDELVGLIGHEASHVNNRHSMKMLCRSLSGYLFVSLILGDANGVMAVIGDNANTLQSLSFSREFEQKADFDGLQIIADNNVNPRGMSNLFKRLQDDKSNFSVPEFLSSHPVTEERINYINKRIKSKSFIIRDNPKLKTLFEQIKK